jgi:hypothetical protein
MIVDAFKETLELGLEKPKQVVVRLFISWSPPNKPAMGTENRARAICPDMNVDLLLCERPLRASARGGYDQTCNTR